jgi:hypothetical protein
MKTQDNKGKSCCRLSAEKLANQMRKTEQKTGERKRNFLNLISTSFLGSSFFFFFTHTYFSAASPYKIKRAFLQTYLEGYVDIQHTNVFTYYKPRFKKTQPQ